MTVDIALWHRRAVRSQQSVNKVLSEIGMPSARVMLLQDVQAKLDGAPVDVQEYFGEAVTCLRSNLTRSAIVVSWSGFFSLFCEALVFSCDAKLRAARPKWEFADATELRETYPEAQIIEAAKTAGFIKNHKRRMLDGWLSQRNQCAHPTVYRPSMNIGIGYVDSMIEETVTVVKSMP